MEITIKDQQYRIGKLSVFEQLKVSRKLLPVLAGLVSDFRNVQAKLTAKDTEGTVKAGCRYASRGIWRSMTLTCS